MGVRSVTGSACAWLFGSASEPLAGAVFAEIAETHALSVWPCDRLSRRNAAPPPHTCVLSSWERTLLQQPCNARRALLDVGWRSLELVTSQSRKAPLLVDLQFESLKVVATDRSRWEVASQKDVDAVLTRADLGVALHPVNDLLIPWIDRTVFDAMVDVQEDEASSQDVANAIVSATLVSAACLLIRGSASLIGGTGSRVFASQSRTSIIGRFSHRAIRSPLALPDHNVFLGVKIQQNVRPDAWLGERYIMHGHASPPLCCLRNFWIMRETVW